MQEEVKEYIWNNIEEQLFEEKIFNILIDLKIKNKKEDFFNTIILIEDLNPNLIKKIETNFIESSMQYKNNFSLLNKLIYIADDEDYLSKIKYIDMIENVISNKNLEYSDDLAMVYLNYAIIKKEQCLYYESIQLALECEKIIINRDKNSKFIVEKLYLLLSELYRNIFEFDKAIYYINLCEKKLSDLEKDKNILYIFINEELSLIHLFKGDIYIADEIFTKVHDFANKNFSSDYFLLSKISRNYSSVKLALNDFDTSEKLLKNSLNIIENKVSSKNLSLLKIYKSFGEYFYFKKEIERSLSYYEKSFISIKESLEKTNLFLIENYVNVAFCYNYLREVDNSKMYLDLALELLNKNQNSHKNVLSKAYNGLGGYYFYKEDYKKAREYFMKALEVKKGIYQKEHLSLSSLYFNLGVNLNKEKKFLDSKNYFKKCLSVREQYLNDNHPEMIISFLSLADTCKKIKEYDDAEKYYLKVLKNGKLIFNEESNEDNFTVLNQENIVSIAYDNFNSMLTYLNKTYFINSDIIKEPLYIRKVFLENFKLLKNFEINLNPRINIIIGENSSGKTSLLQSITLCLLRKNYQGEVNDYEKYISRNEKNAKIKLIFSKYEKEVKLENNTRIIKNNILSPFVLAYGSNIFPINDLNVDKVVNSLLNKTIHLDFTKSLFQEYTDNFYNPQDIVNKLEQMKEIEAKNLKLLFINTINEFLHEFKLVKDSKLEQYYFKNSKTNFELEELSEGYRNNIILITDILIKILGTGNIPSKVEGIILIDEFDRHLHPKWQSDVISKLIKLFPNIQFILTTHNPMAILDREGDQITIIENSDNGFISTQKSGTKFVDVGTILLKYFKVKSLVGENMKTTIDRLTELKLKGNLSELEVNELDELENLLDNTVASNFIYNKAYYNFLLFLKEYKNIDFKDYENMSDSKMKLLMKEFGDLF